MTTTTVHPSFDDESAFVFYRYKPSMAAAILFVVLFIATTSYHIFQMITKKTWYFIPLIIGCFFEIFGYVGRGISAHDQWSLGPYIMQNLLLLIAPSLFAASIYMILGRIIQLVDGESRSLIRKRWLTKLFVTGDVLSFLAQSGGGGMMAQGSASAATNGEHLVVGGLFVQLAFFAFFLVVAILFNRKINRAPTALSTPASPVGSLWRTHMRLLYITSACIMVRSVFRLIEYLDGNAGFFMKNELFVYLFDGLLMLTVLVLFNLVHPGDLTILGHRPIDSELAGLRSTWK
ncbi:RTM1 [Phlyctema vagabunda]|uniref:RTM1 n=1 Tax=Phlyctema vagabunda TaxID=108571 RepID=A0ABR4PV39_9HELO